MSEDIITEENIRRFAEEEAERVTLYLIRRAFYIFTSYINGAVHLYEQRFKVPLNIEMQHVRIKNGVQIYVKLYLDPETVGRIRESVYKHVKQNYMDVRMRLKILKNIIKREFKTCSGGVSALLHDIHPGSGESVDAIGRIRKKVWREKRGLADEGSDEGDIRGDQVEEGGEGEGQ